MRRRQGFTSTRSALSTFNRSAPKSSSASRTTLHLGHCGAASAVGLGTRCKHLRRHGGTDTRARSRARSHSRQHRLARCGENVALVEHDGPSTGGARSDLHTAMYSPLRLSSRSSGRARSAISFSGHRCGDCQRHQQNEIPLPVHVQLLSWFVREIGACGRD
jgi:hypothetical protein